MKFHKAKLNDDIKHNLFWKTHRELKKIVTAIM